MVEPYSQQVVIGLGDPGPFAKLPQSQYWWRLDLVHSEAAATCLQVQHRQQSMIYSFVAPAG